VVRKGYGMLQAYLAKQVEVRYFVFPQPLFSISVILWVYLWLYVL
jgi:hypothetical protein